MADLLHAAMGVVVAGFLYFPLLIGTTMLCDLANSLWKSRDPVDLILGGIVFLLNVGFPLALTLGPAIHNWEKHPLTSITYLGTLLFIWLWGDRQLHVSAAPAVPPGGQHAKNVAQAAASRMVALQPPRQPVEAKPSLKRDKGHTCPKCGGPVRDQQCWSCGLEQ